MQSQQGKGCLRCRLALWALPSKSSSWAVTQVPDSAMIPHRSRRMHARYDLETLLSCDRILRIIVMPPFIVYSRMRRHPDKVSSSDLLTSLLEDTTSSPKLFLPSYNKDVHRSDVVASGYTHSERVNPHRKHLGVSSGDFPAMQGNPSATLDCLRDPVACRAVSKNGS
jgi:hypothetical protein